MLTGSYLIKGMAMSEEDPQKTISDVGVTCYTSTRSKDNIQIDIYIEEKEEV